LYPSSPHVGFCSRGPNNTTSLGQGRRGRSGMRIEGEIKRLKDVWIK
jgi:hypothetical protein